jgi:hypothetical protein
MTPIFSDAPEYQSERQFVQRWCVCFMRKEIRIDQSEVNKRSAGLRTRLKVY